MNEANVPLPDGRSIPVNLRGGGATTISAPFQLNLDMRGSTADSVTQMQAYLDRQFPAMLYKYRRHVVGVGNDVNREKGIRAGGAR